MKIFADARSTNTRKVLTTLAELDVPYDLVHVDFPSGEHKGAAHLARHPFGQIPAIDDDGFTLYETHAICRYLNAKANGPLLPGDLRTRALVDQWMSIETANFCGPAMKLVYHHLLHIPHEPQLLEQASAAIDKVLAVLQVHLSDRRFVGGSTFSLADICFMPYFEYLMLTPGRTLIDGKAEVVRWWNTVRERPSWRKVVDRPQS